MQDTTITISLSRKQRTLVLGLFLVLVPLVVFALGHFYFWQEMKLQLKSSHHVDLVPHRIELPTNRLLSTPKQNSDLHQGLPLYVDKVESIGAFKKLTEIKTGREIYVYPEPANGSMFHVVTDRKYNLHSSEVTEDQFESYMHVFNVTRKDFDWWSTSAEMYSASNRISYKSTMMLGRKENGIYYYRLGDTKILQIGRPGVSGSSSKDIELKFFRSGFWRLDVILSEQNNGDYSQDDVFQIVRYFSTRVR